MNALKDALAGLSLGGLTFALWWKISTGDGYTIVGERYPQFLMIPLVAIVLLGMLFFLIKRKGVTSKLLFVRVVSYIVFSLSYFVFTRNLVGAIQFPGGGNLWRISFFLMSFLFFGLVSWAFKKNREACMIRARSALLIALPFTLFLFVQNVWDASRTYLSLAPMQDDLPKNRVIWFIFDEFDYHTAFEKRPNQLLLKEIDRFKKESFFAEQAIQPGIGTLYSMPAFFSGLKVKDCTAIRDDLLITLDNRKKVSWKNQTNLFEKAYQLGYNTALVGWYHPYDRVFGKHLTYCHVSPLGNSDERTVNPSFPLLFYNTCQSFVAYYLQTIEKLLNIQFGETSFLTSEKTRHYYLTHLEETKRVLLDERYGFVVIHWTIPHTPTIYNGDTKELTIESQRPYLDNLRLLDRTFGEVRRLLEEKGLWDSCVLAVTSDHWYKSDPQLYPKALQPYLKERQKKNGKIPLLIKMAHSHKGLIYDKRWDGHLLHYILYEMMQGRISSPEDICHWLDKNVENTSLYDCL